MGALVTSPLGQQRVPGRPGRDQVPRSARCLPLPEEKPFCPPRCTPLLEALPHLVTLLASGDTECLGGALHEGLGVSPRVRVALAETRFPWPSLYVPWELVSWTRMSENLALCFASKTKEPVRCLFREPVTLILCFEIEDQRIER